MESEEICVSICVTPPTLLGNGSVNNAPVSMNPNATTEELLDASFTM
jgi:hypothetical protein